MATPANPLETSLKGVGFTPDANEDETASSTAVATEEPETTEEVSTEETAEDTREEGAEETSEEGTSETAEGDETATEEEQAQGYDLMLPNQQLKNYPDELYQLAGKKFGIKDLPAYMAKLSTEDQAATRSLLKGKIDSDIEVRNLHDRLDTGAEDEETVVDEREETKSPERTEPITPQRQLEATYNLLRGGLDGNTPIVTKEGAKLYSSALTDSYTQMQEALESGDEKKIEAASVKLTETHAAFATTMFANVFPMLLPHMLQALPSEVWDGIVGGKLEQREEMKETHSTARTELAKDPRYRDLPEMIKSKAIYNFVRENPEVLEKRFVDQDGRVIKDPVKLEMARYRYVVHQIRGQNYRPATELVKKGIEAGKRQANAMAEKKANGKLSTGRTRGSMGGTGTDRYEPKTWAERMKRSSEAANPLGAFLENLK